MYGGANKTMSRESTVCIAGSRRTPKNGIHIAL